MNRFNRRTFCQRAAAGGLAMTIATSAGADGETAIPIIDTHQHLWDLTRFRLNWLEGAPAVLKRDYLTKDYLAATAGLQVVKAVYMEVDVTPEQQTDETEHVLELCRSDQHPTVGAVISGRPEQAGFKDYVNRYAENRWVKGVRRILHADDIPQGLCLQPEFLSSVRLLGEMDKSFDICIRPAELGDALRLVDHCPGTRFIIDHCGNADPKAFVANPVEEPWHDADAWRRSMAELSERPNTICKISGIIARVPASGWDAAVLAPIVNHCLDTFGPERVVFGGDWPVCLLGATYGEWVQALRQITGSRPATERRKLLHDNAARLYRLA